ncbi:MAG: ABC transporter ATP-binding protein [Bacillota bacterium]|jgi:NitT/TauT family transport system ATP-binding protein
MILKLNQIQKNYNDICVLKDFSLQVKKGEIICLIGPSGCGKSTLLNIIAGILQPSAGAIVNHSSRISYMFQEDRLLPWRNVYQNIQIVNKDSRPEQVLELIEHVGLIGFESYYPSQLSGGMRQRAAMARAFNCPADLLLMDEPLKSLDYNLRIAMIGYLVNLWEDTHKAIIFVTHEIDEALLLGDKILVLSDRPAQVIREFAITMPKQGRSLTDTHLTELRNEVINLLQGVST